MSNGLSSAEETRILKCAAYKTCTIPVNIILESSDGVHLGAHMINLENFNNAFPIAGSVTHQFNEPVALSESAAILRLILKFSHNKDCSISSLDLATVIALTDAAEKYGNYPALNACRAALSQFTPVQIKSKIRVLPYRLRYTKVDESFENMIRSTMDIPLRQLVRDLSCFPDIYMVYTVYRELWHAGMAEYRQATDISAYRKLRSKYPKKRSETGPTEEVVKTSSSSLRELKSPACKDVNHIVVTTLELAMRTYPDLDPLKDEALSRWHSGMNQAVAKLPTWKKAGDIVKEELSQRSHILKAKFKSPSKQSDLSASAV
ncbi:hypothetical protein VNI00_017929 [Paramarasmius palmivorus]|uniref:BTB domain-containing protein n=1 Tax=Paramarasmius palmivorus TaxID=297713 RepID=A0AAW0B262_9AGAR